MRLFKEVKLQVDILTLYLSLMVVSFAIIISYTYFKNAHTVIEISDELIAEVSDFIIAEIDDLIKDAEDQVTLNSTLVDNLQQISLENSALVNYMYQSLNTFDEMDALYYGTIEGNFLQYLRLPPNFTYPDNPNKPLPKEYILALIYVDQTSSPPIETWTFQNEDGDNLETYRFATKFDPRERQWYMQAKQIYTIYWTDLYTFQETLRQGITASVPIFDNDYKFIAVSGIDLSLNRISELAAKEKVGKTGKTYVIDTKGTVIVGPELLEHQTKELPILKGPYLAAHKKYISGEKSPFIFEFDGIEYIASFSPFHPSLKKDWLVEIVVPVNDFLYDVISSHVKTLIISLIIALITGIFVWFFSKKIANPIVKLAEEADEIKHFHLEDEITLRSHIKEINLMSSSLNSMKSALRSFSSYIPKEIVKELVEKGQEIAVGGSRKMVTLMFTDIYDFSAITEKIPPETLMSELEEYFAPLSKIIASNKGTIDKYIGDSIMAFWGAPEDLPEHAYYACRAALLCQQQLDLLNKKWKERGMLEFKTRIGIHSGEVVVGNIGTSDRLNYTALGDAVNLASRLEEINKIYHSKITISEDTHKRVSDHFVVRPLDVIAVKGREELVSIYELISSKEESPDLHPNPELEVYAKEFTKGFDLYHKQKWQEAIVVFQSFLEKYPSDQAAKLYLERCKEYLKNPPGPGTEWKSIFQLPTKMKHNI